MDDRGRMPVARFHFRVGTRDYAESVDSDQQIARGANLGCDTYTRSITKSPREAESCWVAYPFGPEQDAYRPPTTEKNISLVRFGEK